MGTKCFVHMGQTRGIKKTPNQWRRSDGGRKVEAKMLKCSCPPSEASVCLAQPHLQLSSSPHPLSLRPKARLSSSPAPKTRMSQRNRAAGLTGGGCLCLCERESESVCVRVCVVVGGEYDGLSQSIVQCTHHRQRPYSTPPCSGIRPLPLPVVGTLYMCV